MSSASYPARCDWCPRKCGANRAAGERGFCGAKNELRIARAALHFWEEPPLSGISGSGAIFFSHCPLHCVYCQNHRIAQGEVGHAIGVDRLVEILFELKHEGALNINFVTPTHYAPLVAHAVADAKRQGFDLPIVWNTSGYETPEMIKSLVGVVDVYLADFKYASRSLAQAYSHAPDYPEVALRAIAMMHECVGDPHFDVYRDQQRLVRGVIVRHLLLPGNLDESLEAIATLKGSFAFADESSRSQGVLLSLMNQYTPVIGPRSAVARRFPNLLDRPSDDEYEQLLDFADTIGIPFYYWQQGGAMEESFIPDFDMTGVLKGE